MNPDRLARRRFERNGLTLAWRDTGGPGRTMVLQHGLGGDATQTAEAFPDDPRFRLVTLECRGHGDSPATGPMSIAAFADDLAALIEAALDPPVVLGGISMGAAIALRLAVTRPALVRALVLVRPAWVDATAPPNLRPNAEVAGLLAALPPAEARATFAASATARGLAATAPDNLASLLGFFDRTDPQATAALLASISAGEPGVTLAEIAGLGVPTRVFGCEEDVIHPLALARRLARLIPGARLEVLPPKGRDRAAHFAALHAALTAFIEEA